MKTAMNWRPTLLGAVLSTIAAMPAAMADGALNATSAGAAGGTTASASAHASASVTTGESGQGCVAESTAEATAEAGDQQKSSSDHKRVVEANGPCRASASSRADAVAGPSTVPSGKE